MEGQTCHVPENFLILNGFVDLLNTNQPGQTSLKIGWSAVVQIGALASRIPTLAAGMNI